MNKVEGIALIERIARLYGLQVTIDGTTPAVPATGSVGSSVANGGALTSGAGSGRKSASVSGFGYVPTNKAKASPVASTKQSTPSTERPPLVLQSKKAAAAAKAGGATGTVSLLSTALSSARGKKRPSADATDADATDGASKPPLESASRKRQRAEAVEAEAAPTEAEGPKGRGGAGGPRGRGGAKRVGGGLLGAALGGIGLLGKKGGGGGGGGGDGGGGGGGAGSGKRSKKKR